MPYYWDDDLHGESFLITDEGRQAVLSSSNQLDFHGKEPKIGSSKIGFHYQCRKIYI